MPAPACTPMAEPNGKTRTVPLFPKKIDSKIIILYSCVCNYILRSLLYMSSNGFVHQFFQVSRAMTNNLDQRMAEYKLTHAQLAIIEYLVKKDDSSSLVDIAKYLNVEKSTITRTVNRLEKNNFIRQVPSNDNRERRIALSDFSNEIQSKVQKTKEAFESKAFKNISNEELDVTFQTLLKIFNNLNGDEQQAK